MCNSGRNSQIKSFILFDRYILLLNNSVEVFVGVYKVQSNSIFSRNDP